MKFGDIPQFPKAHYEIDVGWGYMEEQLKSLSEVCEDYGGLDLDPDFQRTHVWTKRQKIAYVEYQLRGGEVGKHIIFNSPYWMQMRGKRSVTVLVDGKQRLEAVRGFVRNDFKVFGAYHSEFEDRIPMLQTLKFRICSLHTREQVLQLYLNINAGGTPHTKEELDRVRAMLKKEQKKKAKK